MSRIKATQGLTIEDVPQDHRMWMNKFIPPINDFFSQAISILNGGMLFGDNALGKDYVFDFTYQSDALTLPIGFLWTLSSSPKSLQVASATEDNVPVNISVAWSFTENGQVQLTEIVKFTTVPAVSALSAGKRYKIRVRVTP
jgi:hypothetical protein